MLLPLLLDPPNPIAVRFQQTSGMVMAKGVEDTAFYRYTRLGTLTEVGAEPTEFSVSAEEFHHRHAAPAGGPATVHDHAVHARHQAQRGRAGPGSRSSRNCRTSGRPRWPPSANWPRCPTAPSRTCCGRQSSVPGRRRGNVCRATQRRLPARRGNSTTWTNPDEDFEARVKAAVDAAFDDARVTTVVEDFVARIDSAAASNSLAAKIIQLTMPGVPDVYQGSEFWERSLTDPDNRRPVDFAQREKELAAIDAGTLPGQAPKPASCW